MIRHNTVLLAFILASQVEGQIQVNHRLEPIGASRALHALDLGGGNTLYLAERKFGWDSTHVALLFTAPDHTLLDATAYRGQGPITFLFDAEPSSPGHLVCGSHSSAGLTYPFIMHLDGAGAVDWYKTIDGIGGVGYFNDQLGVLVPDGPSFTAYTKRSGMVANGSYRIEGEATGTSWSGASMSAPAGVLFSPYKAAPTAVPGEHLVAGTGALSAGGDQVRSVMLMRTTPGGASWMKFFDILPATSAQFEDPHGIVPTSDGNFLIVGYLTTGGTSFEGFLMKVAPDGTQLWCRRYADASGGLTLNAVTEMPGGGLLVAGADAAYQVMVLDLQSDGGLLQARRYQSSTGAADIVQRFYSNGVGDLKLLVNDKSIAFNNGASCNFITVSTVTSTMVTPLEADFVMTNAAFSPVVQDLTAQARPMDLGWVQDCILTDLREPVTTGPVAPRPVPTEGMIWLDGTPGAEPIGVYDPTGMMVIDAHYAGGIDLGGLAPGIYVVVRPGTGGRWRVIKQ